MTVQFLLRTAFFVVLWYALVTTLYGERSVIFLRAILVGKRVATSVCVEHTYYNILSLFVHNKISLSFFFAAYRWRSHFLSALNTIHL